MANWAISPRQMAGNGFKAAVYLKEPGVVQGGSLHPPLAVCMRVGPVKDRLERSLLSWVYESGP